MRTKIFQVAVAAVLATSLGTLLDSCGTLVGNPEGHDGGTTKGGSTPKVVDRSKPTDTTGATGSVSLAISSGLTLDDPAPSLKVGDKIVLSYAKLRVTGIALYGAKERSSAESARSQALKANQVAAAKDLEAKVEGDAAALALTNAEDVANDNGNATGNATGNGGATGNGNGNAGGNGSGVGQSHKEAHTAKLAAIKAQLDVLRASATAEEADEADGDVNVRFKGPFLYDAIAGAFDGAAPKVDLSDGGYRRVEFHLHPHFPDQATDAAIDDPLTGNVFAVRGTVTSGDIAVPFAVDWHAALNILARGDGAFSVTPGADNPLALVFDPAKWFDGVDLSLATVDADGTIYIDQNTNADVMQAIRKNLVANVAFGKAGNDGKLKAADVAGKGEDGDAE